jgi:hypothetical protein
MAVEFWRTEKWNNNGLTMMHNNNSGKISKISVAFISWNDDICRTVKQKIVL